MSKFIYILNAMEHAAQASNPALEEFGQKRRAVLEYVEALERRCSETVHSVPEGWVLVPIASTVEMQTAICDNIFAAEWAGESPKLQAKCRSEAADVWSAALASSPSAPDGEAGHCPKCGKTASSLKPCLLDDCPVCCYEPEESK